MYINPNRPTFISSNNNSISTFYLHSTTINTMGINICKPCSSSKSSIHPAGFEDKFLLVDRIGEGGFGDVYTCIQTSNGKTHAAKLIDNADVSEWSTTDTDRVPMEVKTLTACDHPSVIKLIDYFVFHKHSIIIMEKPAEAVDLFNYVAYLGGLAEGEARTVMRNIVQAVWYLHYSARICHRDIKPENVLIDVRTRSIKLIDFGSATFFSNMTFSDFTGTRLYAPPELILTNKYKAEPLTTWSLGVTLYFILHCKLPFNSEECILRADPEISHLYSVGCKQFLRDAMCPLSARRPTVDALGRHPWLENMGFYFK